MSKCPIITKECLGKECAFWNENCLIKLALQKYLDPLSLKKINNYPFSFSTSDSKDPSYWSGLQGGL